MLVVPQQPRRPAGQHEERGVRSDPAGGLADSVLDDVGASARELGDERARVGLSGVFPGWSQALAGSPP